MHGVWIGKNVYLCLKKFPFYYIQLAEKMKKNVKLIWQKIWCVVRKVRNVKKKKAFVRDDAPFKKVMLILNKI